MGQLRQVQVQIKKMSSNIRNVYFTDGLGVLYKDSRLQQLILLHLRSRHEKKCSEDVCINHS